MKSPATEAQGEAFHDEVVPVIGKIIIDPRHRPVDYKSPLGQQLRRSIAEILVQIHQKPMFVDTVEELLTARDEAIAFVHSTETTGAVFPGEDQSDEESDSSSSLEASPEPEPNPPARKRKKVHRQPKQSKNVKKASKGAPPAPKKLKQTTPVPGGSRKVSAAKPKTPSSSGSGPRPRASSVPSPAVAVIQVDGDQVTTNPGSSSAFVSPLSQLRHSIHPGTDPPFI
jgi:hypothetical protein